MKYKYCDYFLEYMNFKGNLTEQKCLCCNKNFQHQFDEILEKIFFNTYKFSNNDTNKFLLLLQKSIYPYEYMDDWEKFSETSLPGNKGYYSHLNMEDATNSDLLSADVFENFRDMCLKRYKLDPGNILSGPGLAWKGALKKTKVKLDLLTDIDMLLMVEVGIGGKICHSNYQHPKSNNKYIKDCNKNKESSYIQYWDANILCEQAMLKKPPANHFQWTKDTSQFKEDFMKKLK